MSGIGSMVFEVFRGGLFWLTQAWGGNLAAAIVSFSAVARLAVLPLSIRATLRARARARAMKVLQPELEAVRKRHADDPRRQIRETSAVFQRHGLSMVDLGLFKGAALQAPIFIGVFHAVRAALASRLGEQGVWWVVSLARPDVGIALLVFALVGLGAAAGASETQPTWTLAIPAAVSAVMALTLSAGFGLYLATSGAVGIVQGLAVRHIEARRRLDAVGQGGHR